MMCNHFSLLFTVMTCFCSFSLNSALPDMKNIKKIKKEYMKIHKEFRSKMCVAGAENEFWKKFKDFRGDGYHVPIMLDGTLDKKTVAYFISEISNKRDWIKLEISKLKKGISFNALEKKLDALEVKFNEHINLKEKFFDSKIEEEGDLISRESLKGLAVLRKEARAFLLDISFLHSFRFPVDHYAWRKRYDELKERRDFWGRHEANKIFFARKIIQDGAQNQNRSRGDRFLRAAIDTVYITLRDFHEPFITENLRSDMNYIFSRIKKHLKNGGKKQQDRLYEWLDRTGRFYKFYDDLLNSKDVKVGQQMIETKAKARFELKDLVLKKQKAVYQYWKQKDVIYRYLYVMDTIMFNEAGGLDGRDALERKTIARVVINRHNDEVYSMFDKLDGLRGRFADVSDESLKKNKWLNVLFKEGEFSFTYYFIPSTVRVFCQSMTRLGRFLRSENIDIALEVGRKNIEDKLKPLRYFSRASMLGRIDMSSIWSSYQVIPERVGTKVIKDLKKIKKLIRKSSYKYRYDFIAENGKSYKVIEVNKKGYVLSRLNGTLYKHRSPHSFTYFSRAAGQN